MSLSSAIFTDLKCWKIAAFNHCLDRRNFKALCEGAVHVK